MDEKVISGIKPMEEIDYKGKTVLLRLDINSPIDPITKKIVNINRINMSLPTLRYLLSQNAKIAIIAHQGDTLDYENLIPMEEHAEILSEKLGKRVKYIDDVCGPAAQEAVKNLKEGEMILLGNLRYLSEEISTFEKAVKLKPEEMLNTYLVRSLTPIVDCYVNDAFSAAHRNAPSMVAFEEILPTAAGILMMKELSALTKVMESPDKPLVFILGGAKISDAFGMMKEVLSSGVADKILTCGITGHIMLLAKGYNIGKTNLKFIQDRGLDEFVKPAKEYLENYSGKILFPVDLALEKNGDRIEVGIDMFPVDEICMDIGHKTVDIYKSEIAKAGTIFVNGPAGVYENSLFEYGTKEIWNSFTEAKGYSVIGGGDTVSAAAKFIDTNNIGYICTAGGAMVKFISGIKLPLIEAMKKSLIVK